MVCEDLEARLLSSWRRLGGKGSYQVEDLLVEWLWRSSWFNKCRGRCIGQENVGSMLKDLDWGGLWWWIKLEGLEHSESLEVCREGPKDDKYCGHQDLKACETREYEKMILTFYIEFFNMDLLNQRTVILVKIDEKAQVLN